MKRLSRFLPSERIPLEQADHHYESIHHRFAMRMFREHAPRVRLYAINHAVGQLDLTGTFRRRPSAWRFVILEFDDPDPAADEGATEFLPAWTEAWIVDDHTNCLREVRPFEVEPTTVVDLRTQQTSLAKCLLEVEARNGSGSAAAEEAYARIGEAVSASSAFGLRLVVRNRAIREAEMAAVSEPGQAYTGRYFDATTMVGIDEIYFDHRDWAEEFFRGISNVLRPDPAYKVSVHAVEELIGVDRR